MLTASISVSYDHGGFALRAKRLAHNPALSGTSLRQVSSMANDSKRWVTPRNVQASHFSQLMTEGASFMGTAGLCFALVGIMFVHTTITTDLLAFVFSVFTIVGSLIVAGISQYGPMLINSPRPRTTADNCLLHAKVILYIELLISFFCVFS